MSLRYGVTDHAWIKDDTTHGTDASTSHDFLHFFCRENQSTGAQCTRTSEASACKAESRSSWWLSSKKTPDPPAYATYAVLVKVSLIQQATESPVVCKRSFANECVRMLRGWWECGKEASMCVCALRKSCFLRAS